MTLNEVHTNLIKILHEINEKKRFIKREADIIPKKVHFDKSEIVTVASGGKHERDPYAGEVIIPKKISVKLIKITDNPDHIRYKFRVYLT